MMGKGVPVAGCRGARFVFIKDGSGRWGQGCGWTQGSRSLIWEEKGWGRGELAQTHGGEGESTTWHKALVYLRWLLQDQGISEMPHSLAALPRNQGDRNSGSWHLPSLPSFLFLGVWPETGGG